MPNQEHSSPLGPFLVGVETGRKQNTVDVSPGQGGGIKEVDHILFGVETNVPGRQEIAVLLVVELRRERRRR